RDPLVTGVQTCALPICTLGTLNSELKSLQENLKKQTTTPEILTKAAEVLAAQVGELHKRVMLQINAQVFSENAGPSDQLTVPPRSEEHTSELQSRVDLV